jgi:hypothetical protein
MPSSPARSQPWFSSCLAAVAIAGVLAVGSCVALGVWAFWPIAGVEDLPEVRSNAEPLISAIDRYVEGWLR